MLAVTPAPRRPGDRALGQALADELVLASQMLADLAYDLGSDPATLRRHLTSIQEIDRVTQMQLAIAELLRAGSDTDAGVRAITLEDMRERITLRLGGAA